MQLTKLTLSRRRAPGDHAQVLISQDASAGPVPPLGLVLAPRRDLPQHATRARAQLCPALDALVAEPGVARLIGGQNLDPAKLLFRPLQAPKGLELPDQMVVQQEEISDILQRV